MFDTIDCWKITLCPSSYNIDTALPLLHCFQTVIVWRNYFVDAAVVRYNKGNISLLIII
jgi:hypothetical protein